MFFSTRDENLRLTASEVILKGISDEGGLFLPAEIKSLKADSALLKLSYTELAYEILSLYLDDFSKEEIEWSVNQAYDKNHFEREVLKTSSFDSFSILELFHGQTLTFKDMALSLLPYLMKIAKSKHPEAKNISILTATSGDTGSAVLSSFSQVEDIRVSILYPKGGISPLQEKQMLFFTNDHARAYALENSNFDTCQSLVKNMLIKKEGQGFTSANSINIGRLLPQVVYYYYSYLDLVRQGKIKLGDKVDYVVPTGNFGDIFAGYIAKMMSLPIGRLVVASNQNNILTDFFKTGVYDLNRQFIKTNSPSMDILISSNLERLLFYTLKSSSEVASLMNDLKVKGKFIIDKNNLSSLNHDFSAFCCLEKDTDKAINDCFEEYGQLLDPHSAVGYHAYKEYVKNNKGNHVVLIATASPLKFPKTILNAFNIKYEGDEIDALNTMKQKFKMILPPALEKVLANKTPPLYLKPDEVESEICNKHIYKVIVPATSANLGPGFDVLGLALDLHSAFTFTKSSKMELVGFPDLEGQPNLVLSAYKEAFIFAGLKPVEAKIVQVEDRVPVSRGLGSSSSCIVAGLLGANCLMHNKLSLSQIYALAVKIEGHPDNVGPCLYGGLIANLNDEGEYEPHNLCVSSSWRFLLMIPDQEVSTKQARAILPKEYPLGIISQNTSKAVVLPSAFDKGDINALAKCLKDAIHVPYRRKLIADYDCFDKIVSGKYGFPMTISGSGSTMIAFYLDSQEEKIDALIKELESIKTHNQTEFIKTSLDKTGARIIKEDISYE